MSIRPFRDIKRRKTKKIKVGKVVVGGDALISVQSMTNTLTTDVEATIKQINELDEAGADIVRVSCPDQDSSLSLNKILKHVNVPIVADIHFHYKRAIEAANSGASCLRINPGNIGSKEKVKEILKAAKDNNCSIRVGVNAGSLAKSLLEKYKEPCPEALVESAINNIKLLEDEDFFNFKISVKSSDVFLSIKAYRSLSKLCSYPLHLGITEAGGLTSGSIKSSIGIGMLLMEGIGDTIRVSLTPENTKNRTEEVEVCQQILSSLGIRSYAPKVISCPGCGRTSNDYFIELSKSIKHYIQDNMPQWKSKYPGIEDLKIAVMGCIVNGPGESKQADIGISLPGNNEDPSVPVFVGGKKFKTLKGENIEKEFIDILQEYIEDRYN